MAASEKEFGARGANTIRKTCCFARRYCHSETYFLAPEEMGAFALIAAAREADEAMRQRVDHDLYCIDIRSLGFDLYILLLTVISPKAGRNAR